ncbi:IclR family transcriptional regulator [Jiangella asiatica]|uniref:IclR family transcriptional regulator n=1 Tax=Jiangella asiatica TaxID=2530372 RepID=UPI0013A5ED3E|nr:IclR family transcriptional regulator [Jiangella asiatica]
MARTTRRASVDDDRPASANYHANALARGLALLELLASGAEPKTLVQISDETGLPKSTLVRLLAVLNEMDYVVRVDDRPSYRLGHKVLRLSNAYMSSLDLSVVADRYLAPLAVRTGQTANLGMLDGDQVIHVGVHEPDRPIRFRASPGVRDHSYCTGLGKMLLSRLEADQVAAHVPPGPFERFTDDTITTMDELVRELRRIQRRGYAFDDNERSVGLRCVAVPVEVDGECLAAVSVSGPSGEFGPDRQQSYLERLRETAAELAGDPDTASALRIVHSSLRPAQSAG